ncbi:MAG: hypothetical protein ACFN4K_05230 [Pauljensenia sp.]
MNARALSGGAIAVFAAQVVSASPAGSLPWALYPRAGSLVGPCPVFVAEEIDLPGGVVEAWQRRAQTRFRS